MTRKVVMAIAVAGYAMLHVPLILLIAWSFNASPSGARWTGFTLDWYRALWHRSDLLGALRTSLIVGIIATVISTAIGTVGALGLGRRRWRTTQLVEGFLLFPIVTPEVVAGISLLILFAAAGIRLGLLTVIIAHATFCIPFTMLVVLARLRGMDHTLEDAALSLGADELAAFRRVTLPLLLPGVVSAALLAFTLSFDDFIITFFTAGPGTSTLPLVVYGMVRRTVEPTVNALSALLVAGTTVLLIAAQRWMGGGHAAGAG